MGANYPKELIIKVLKRIQDGERVNSLAKELNIPEATIRGWKRSKTIVELDDDGNIIEDKTPIPKAETKKINLQSTTPDDVLEYVQPILTGEKSIRAVANELNTTYHQVYGWVKRAELLLKKEKKKKKVKHRRIFKDTEVVTPKVSSPSTAIVVQQVTSDMAMTVLKLQNEYLKKLLELHGIGY
jgi:uncharacterized protein YjcR